MSSPTLRDTVRQSVVVSSAVIAVVGAFVGSGAAGGTPIAEAAGGALGADSTLVAPAGGAFAIWSVIYLGLVAYAFWQLLPAQKTDARQRALGYPIAVTLILNAAWILSVQAGYLALSALVIVMLLASLCYAFAMTLRSRPRTVIETIVLDGTVGLYLGWVSIATAANLTAWLQQAGFTGWGLPAEVWGVAVVAVAGLVGVLLAVYGRGRLAPMFSLTWGIVWVAVCRLTGTLPSTPVAIAALVAAAVVIIATIVARLRARSAGLPRR
ncbi:tryptophan-rich sensory protein [Subtercola sp. PAMC28395]|uniref:tryptophan-rich sensory protein n=1 Tax=Subtercola sp. PAMC28395 TaxID=2846775 RepID=UPI001C0B09A3|nr:tryptophan-rich sensory protein [Subtercola sp. PAMC28395]QWT24264.1 tryptophan-rich sensory protein [Subtercola sp. PAMC28395]